MTPADALPRAFAIIPAAGESRRMGSPKLLLPLQGVPLIAHTIAAWQAAGLNPLVVVRPSDIELAKVCRAYGANVLVPETPPAEMKVSVQLALSHLREKYQPANDIAWLLAPADMPRLSPAIIGRLLDEHCDCVAAHRSWEILVPTCGSKRGHPVLFPWSLAEHVDLLAANEGVKALLERHPVREIGCDDLLTKDHAAFADVDTRADFEAL